MLVALDATYALDRTPSGVARYSNALVRELAALSEVELVLCARWPRVLRLRRHFSGLRFRRCWLDGPTRSDLAASAHVFHALNQRLPRARFRACVVTIHDVFPITADTYSSTEFRRKFSDVIADAVSRAQRIICVSNYTREQLGLALGVPAEKCDVVHHGTEQDPPPPSAAAQRRALALAGDAPFFLAVGAVQVRKNTLAAVRAVEQVPGARLIIAGSAGHGSEQVAAYITRQNLGDRVRFAGYVNDDLLEALYRRATALLFPSIEEGFGLPVLEAMVRGLPVIASNASSIPEIAGDAAALLPPHDLEGFSAACWRMLEDEGWRAEWIARGRRHVRRFTWGRAAAATMNVYRRMIS